jgi:7,8-dihydro-6-hydroxymethylpterin-pyrophosphokinase
MPEDHISLPLDVLVQAQPGLGPAQEALQRALAFLDRGGSQIGAIELEQVSKAYTNTAWSSRRRRNLWNAPARSHHGLSVDQAGADLQSVDRGHDQREAAAPEVAVPG